MDSFTLSKTKTIDPASIIEFHRACAREEINANEYIVLAVLVEGACLIDGEPNVAISRYEIATRCGLSWQKVQRALTELHERGLIGRRQHAKKSGEVALTVVSAKAYALFGLEGGADIGPASLPREFWGLVAGESEAVISTVARLWREGELPTPELSVSFRGAGRAWAQIEFLLSGRAETMAYERLAAAEEASHRNQLEEAGKHTLDLPDGSTVVFDQAALRSMDGENYADAAFRSADLRFARDTLAILCSRFPGMVTHENVARLSAEILFSRQKGFVWKHDYSDACRVLASVIGRGDWKRPKRMETRWYEACAATLHPFYSQGVQPCVS